MIDYNNILKSKAFTFGILWVAMNSIIIAHSKQSPDGVLISFCDEFAATFDQVSGILAQQRGAAETVRSLGIDTSWNDVFVGLMESSDSDNARISMELTVTLQIFQNEKNISIADFTEIAKKCLLSGVFEKPQTKIHSKYRSIDGGGNNLNNPDWGKVDTPFARFGSKNFDDGIYSIKKSVVDGSDLPNPRKIVQEILTKAVRSPPPPLIYNQMSLLLILFVTHDVHFQVPKRLSQTSSELKCCTKHNERKLPEHLINADCLPIDIPSNDEFYKHGRIGCINIVRSQLGRYADGVETGEIMNRATAYMDLSLIYGNRKSELKPIRLCIDGKLRMDRDNVLPVDKDEQYLPSMQRFVSTPIATIWPALFTRNHNQLAGKLAKMNSHWNDEKIFQEARRINIAIFQRNLITAKAIERVFGQEVNESYSEERNVATTLEFAISYRAAHYYVPSELSFETENGTKTGIPQSDTIGKFATTVLPNFDDALRAAINNPVNVGPYSDEITNKLNKNRHGFGVDLISIDIQRSRDHGLPSFLEIRRLCNLTPVIESFDDFKLILNETNVDLLKKLYKSPEDVEFYVGGLLETFENLGSPLAGPTFGCVIGENYRNIMGGDIYFYDNPSNPYPFTQSQLEAVGNFSMNHLFCSNSNLKVTNELFAYIETSSTNSKFECSNYLPMDLSAWKNTERKSE